MTSTSPTPPDLSALSISPQQNHIHEQAYDYDPLAVGHNQRQQSQFLFSSNAGIPSQMQYNPLSLGQSPLKNKNIARAGLPSVCLSRYSTNSLTQIIYSNGLTVKSWTTRGLCPPLQTLISLLVVPLLYPIFRYPCKLRQSVHRVTTRLSPLQ